MKRLGKYPIAGLQNEGKHVEDTNHLTYMIWWEDKGDIV